MLCFKLGLFLLGTDFACSPSSENRNLHAKPCDSRTGVPFLQGRCRIHSCFLTAAGLFGDCHWDEAALLEWVRMESTRGDKQVSGDKCIEILIWRDLGKQP